MKLLLLIPLAFSVASAGTLCDICEKLMKTLENHAFSSESSLQHYLDNECKSITSNWLLQNLCTDLVNHYLPQIFNDLKKHLPPSKICKDIRVCGIAELTARDISKRSSWECGICEKGVDYLDKELQSPAVEGKIKAVFLQACDVIPAGQDRQICQNVINQYFPQLWAKILTFLNGKEICTDIGLCSSNLLDLDGNPLQNLGCSFCKTVFTWFQKQILTPATENEILGEIYKVCDMVPNQDYMQQCKAVVKKYGDELFKKITEILGPDSICKMVHACPA